MIESANSPTFIPTKEYINKINDNYILDNYSSYLKYSKHYWSCNPLVASNNCLDYNNLPDFKKMMNMISNHSELFFDGNAFEYGFGGGRNILNLFNASKFNEVHGCDIAPNYISIADYYLKSNDIPESKYKLIETFGHNTGNHDGYEYSLIFSYTSMVCIPIYDIRLNILKDMYKRLKTGGVLSIEFAQVNDYAHVEYYNNKIPENGSVSSPPTHGGVEDASQIITDLELIGFDADNISHFVGVELNDSRISYIFWCVK